MSPLCKGRCMISANFFYSLCNFRAEIQSQAWKMCCLPNMTNTKDGLEKVCWYSVCTVLAGTMLHLMNYTIHASHGIHQTSVESRSTVKVIRGSVFLKIWMWNLFPFFPFNSLKFTVRFPPINIKKHNVILSEWSSSRAALKLFQGDC